MQFKIDLGKKTKIKDRSRKNDVEVSSLTVIGVMWEMTRDRVILRTKEGSALVIDTHLTRPSVVAFQKAISDLVKVDLGILVEAQPTDPNRIVIPPSK